MKKLLILLNAIFLIMSACSKSNTNSTTGDYPAVKDTVKIAAIDTIVSQIGMQWKRDESNFHRIGINERDTVEYIELNGEAPRISSIFATDSTLTWVVFIQVNNELQLVRFRESRAKPTPNVFEALSYFDKGKLFYSKERGRVLQEGDQISVFRDAVFIENARPADLLIAEYAKYWEISKKAVEQDMQSNK